VVLFEFEFELMLLFLVSLSDREVELDELWVEGDELEEWVVVEDEDDTDLDDRLDGIDSNVLSATVALVLFGA